MANYGKLRQVWQNMAKQNMASMAKCGPILPFMIPYNQLRTNMTNYGQLWPSMINMAKVTMTRMVQFDLLRPDMTSYGQV
jgi:hypothetical protein